MSENTSIEWCDHTFNPWEGCQKVGPGCDHCYAEARNARFAGGTAINWGPGAPRRRTSVSNWNKPLAWNKAHAEFFAAHGRRQRVFCASLADVFDNAVDPQWRRDLFDLIELTPNLDWLLLTKRIGNVFEMVSRAKCHDWLAGRRNVILGATIVNQEEADRDIPKLLAMPAARRFLSMEPLLGPVDLTSIDDGAAHREVPVEEWGIVDDEDSPPGLWWNVLSGERHIMHGGAGNNWTRADASIDWVIVGGESGRGARPMHPDWVRSLRDQCASAGVRFLFKQWGEWHGPADPIPGGSMGDEMRRGVVQLLHAPGNPEGFFRRGDAFVRRVGKKAAGRQLDGVQYDGFPQV